MEANMVGELKAIIDEHSVHYKTWPHYEIADGKQIMVGFDLELHGTHDHGNTSLSPGCPACVKTVADLRHVAQWIMPKEERPSMYEVVASSQSLSFCKVKRRWEVILPIRIEHRHNCLGPIDDCEQRCLREMKGKLAEVGVQEGPTAIS